MVIVDHAVHDSIGDLGMTVAVAIGVVVLQLALVPPQSLLDPLGRHVESDLWITGFARRVKIDPGVQVDSAVC
ncbi:hypothetical protein D3C87_2110420 [compost metagenome]